MKSYRSNSIFFALTFLLLFQLGCGNSLQSKLSGKWVIDTDEDLFAMIGDEAESRDNEDAKFSLDFQSGGVFGSKVIASGHEQVKTGRWLFVEGQADLCKIRVSINSANSKLEPDNVLTDIKFIDENTIELIPPNMDAIKHKMQFRRAK